MDLVGDGVLRGLAKKDARVVLLVINFSVARNYSLNFRCHEEKKVFRAISDWFNF